MRKAIKTLSLVLTLVLALAAFAPVALAASYRPGIGSASSSSSGIASVTPGTFNATSGTQTVTVKYTSSTVGNLPTSATISLGIVEYEDGAAPRSTVTGVSAVPSSNAISVVPTDTALTISYNPYSWGTSSFTIALSGTVTGGVATSTITIAFELAASSGSSSTPGSSYPYYYNAVTLDLDKPSTMYAGDVYTLSAKVTRPYNSSSSYYYGYEGDLYALYTYNGKSSYYPYNSSRAQVYTEDGWITPYYSLTTYTLANLNSMGVTPRIYWSSVSTYTYPYGYNPYYDYTYSSGSSVKVTFSTDTSSSIVKISAVSDQSANFQAMEPGTYTITLSVPSGYTVTNGDNSSYYYNPYAYYGSVYDNPYYYSMLYGTTKKSYTVTVLPKPGASTTVTTPTATPAPSSTPLNGRIGKVLKNGVSVTNAAGVEIGTVNMSDIVIYEIVGSKYRFTYNGGDGYITKSLVNLTDKTK